MKKIHLFFLFISIQILTALFYELNSKEQETSNCYDREDTNTCQEVEYHELTGHQCCTMNQKIIFNGNTSYPPKKCDQMFYPIDDSLKEMNTEAGNEMFKEYLGSTLYMASAITIDDNYYQEWNLSCKDGEIDKVIKSDDFNDEEKKIFQTDDYCLKYTKYDKENEVKKNDCFGYKLVTRNPSLSCGYYDIEINYEDKTKDNAKLCFMFNDDMIKNKNPGFVIRAVIANTINNITNKEINNYKFTSTNSKGKILKYDSTTNKIENSKSSLSNFFSLKYLIIIISFLF